MRSYSKRLFSQDFGFSGFFILDFSEHFFQGFPDLGLPTVFGPLVIMVTALGSSLGMSVGSDFYSSLGSAGT